MSTTADQPEVDLPIIPVDCTLPENVTLTKCVAVPTASPSPWDEQVKYPPIGIIDLNQPEVVVPATPPAPPELADTGAPLTADLTITVAVALVLAGVALRGIFRRLA